ncbi:uncharacterized protein LOC112571303 isoform X2 [Pomacea canaliculata]|uniref:uncharacterized protein LOC112571303 isoform X2 n=1 Tax=Pomacea canaliculata TaxID=400727 RepID=UPI000D72FFA1|nr:uncharacterized protein LOC112571303 isoform X2 [Pomacea canaliculata]
MAAETLSMTLIAVCVFVLLPYASSRVKIPPPAEPVHYVGCMIPDHMVSMTFTVDTIGKNPTDRLGPFRHVHRDLKYTAVEHCVFSCWIEKNTYAGIQNGRDCFCSDSLSGMTGLLEKDCNIHCNSACNDRCGGLVALSVFKTSYHDVPTTFINASEFSSGYLGCFKHAEQEMCWTETEMQVHKSDPQFANLPYLPRVFSTRLSAQACAVYCITSKMKYTVILNLFHCCCGWNDRTLNHPARDPDLCTQMCSGDETTPCYGDDHGASYSAIFNNIALMEKTDLPVMTLEQFNATGILYPYYPGGVVSKRRTADVIAYLGGLGSLPVKTQTGILPGKATQQIVDPTNTGVGVVDVPEKSSDKHLKTILGVISAVLMGVFVAVFCVTSVKKSKATSTE